MITPHELLNARILIVDDQAANIVLMTQLLEEAGYTQVMSTMDPTSVCDHHRSNPFDLILLDLQMPKMDGFEVIAALKSCISDSYLPVIVLTAQPGHKLRALQAGAKDFLSKPLDLVEVKARIHNMLEVRLLYKKLESANHMLEETVRQRTAQLRESEARYKCLTELASDWYWEQNDKGSFTKVSGPVQEMLGIKVASLDSDEDSAADDGASDGWNEDERTVLKAKIAAREPFLDFSFRRTLHDGTTRRFRVSGQPIFDSSCQLIGYRGVGVETDMAR